MADVARPPVALVVVLVIAVRAFSLDGDCGTELDLDADLCSPFLPRFPVLPFLDSPASPASPILDTSSPPPDTLLTNLLAAANRVCSKCCILNSRITSAVILRFSCNACTSLGNVLGNATTLSSFLCVKSCWFT
ncbi:hypothetical protein BCR44DRAFT_1437466 [Catenaria anguillulae PL171]|uniref:Uncharacterized protein n=1 Tax=Catenaria anguillulae PL171 TaxID=765915 RepID=A0A1Y2HGK3_9FUNG|nr:hypothetical protein BCR44DRAFT_1437466 [Catenaria anguillulae PL171]